jgi:hypothetical protein
MNARVVISLAVIAALAGTAAASNYGRDDGMRIDFVAANPITFEGAPAWEYVYDISVRNAGGKDHSETFNMGVQFEFGDGGTIADHILNMYDNGSEWRHWDIWDQTATTGQVMSSWGSPVTTGPWPAYGYRDTDTWVLTPPPGDLGPEGWAYDPAYTAARGKLNTWHVPSDYADVALQGNILHWWQGEQTDWAGDDGIADDLLYWYNGWWAQSDDYLLYRTLYYVSDLGPYGTVEVGYDSGWSGNVGAVGGPVVGPGVPEPATMGLLALGGLAVLRRRKK